MKIRHPAALRAAGFAGAWALKALVGSLRYRSRFLQPDTDPLLPGQPRRFIYAFWHETMLLPTYHYGVTRAKVLISEHADGEMIAQLCRHLGLGAVRGSTTRGGAAALREILALENRHHVVITPDGPRGPRRVVQPGLVFLAAKTGLPVVPVGFAFHRCWRLPSWDRFAVPWPFSPAVGVAAPAIEVPARLGRDGIEAYRARVEAALLDATDRAERWASRERW
jgi:lysophospholipid acyltransferase (LPLAT)-like uncharacterized protein